MTAAPDLKPLTALERQDLERIRQKLMRLKGLTQTGKPGIRQLRKILNADIAEVDAALRADALLRSKAKTSGDTSGDTDG